MQRLRSPDTVLVVDSDPHTLTRTVELLTGAGYRTTGTFTFEEAKQLLAANSPDLLIADVRLGAFNGLQLVLRRRVDHPESASIVTNVDADPVLEREAKRLNAPFLVKPLNPVALTTLVGQMLGAGVPARSPQRRRWPRKPVAGGFAAAVGGTAATVLDMSYEGFRLEIAEVSESPMASPFTINIPAFELSVSASQVWTKRIPVRDAVWYGAVLRETNSESGSAWRGVVDALG